MSLEFILAQIKREEEDAYHTLVKKGRHREIRQYELGYSRNKRFVYVGDVETQPKQFQIPVYFLSVEYNVYATDQELIIQINQPLPTIEEIQPYNQGLFGMTFTKDKVKAFLKQTGHSELQTKRAANSKLLKSLFRDIWQNKETERDIVRDFIYHQFLDLRFIATTKNKDRLIFLTDDLDNKLEPYIDKILDHAHDRLETLVPKEESPYIKQVTDTINQYIQDNQTALEEMKRYPSDTHSIPHYINNSYFIIQLDKAHLALAHHVNKISNGTYAPHYIHILNPQSFDVLDTFYADASKRDSLFYTLGKYRHEKPTTPYQFKGQTQISDINHDPILIGLEKKDLPLAIQRLNILAFQTMLTYDIDPNVLEKLLHSDLNCELSIDLLVQQLPIKENQHKRRLHQILGMSKNMFHYFKQHDYFMNLQGYQHINVLLEINETVQNFKQSLAIFDKIATNCNPQKLALVQEEGSWLGVLDRHEINRIGNIFHQIKRLNHSFDLSKQYDKLFNYLDNVREEEFILSYESICRMWSDTLENNRRLETPLNKFPKPLVIEHNKQSMLVQLQQETKALNLKDRAREDLIFENDRFIIKPCYSNTQLIKEGASLDHCVGSYGIRIAEGKTNVLFLREKEHPNQPFITLEVSNTDFLVQAQGRFNRHDSLDKDGIEFVKEWLNEKNLKTNIYYLKEPT